jgi:hypothetical protein
MGRKQADVNSYAPNLVLQTDLFRIDFRETRVVLSRRESKQAVWSQTSPKRSAEDSALEALVLKGISPSRIRDCGIMDQGAEEMSAVAQRTPTLP